MNDMETIDPDQVYSFASDVVLEVFEGESLVLNLAREVVYSLNGTGTRIAMLISEGKRVTQVVEVLGSEYEVTQTELEEEVVALVCTLLDRGLIVPGSGRSAR